MKLNSKKEIYAEVERRLKEMPDKARMRAHSFYLQADRGALKEFDDIKEIHMSNEFERGYLTFYGMNEKHSIILLIK